VLFRSLRTRLQAAFVSLGLAAIVTTEWQASSVAAASLEQASFDRLTAVREMRASELERYFANIRAQVGALASDTATISAVDRFHEAFMYLPEPTDAQLEQIATYYRDTASPESWLPQDPGARALQHAFLADSPHPLGAKDLLVSAPQLGAYGSAHALYHSTFHRYKTAFGFYDLFLIAPNGQILYSVMKEIDLGVRLEDSPYVDTALATAFRNASLQPNEAPPVIEDYAPYPPSANAPAAFVATPIRRAGAIIGILAVQIAIDEVNDVMDGGMRWREQGLGSSGQVFVVGPDNLLRSDLRTRIEQPEQYLLDLESAGVARDVIDKIRRNRTAVLAYAVELPSSERAGQDRAGIELGHGLRGTPVLRSRGPLRVAGLNWTIVAEIDSGEALAPVDALQSRIIAVGLLIALVFFLVAGWLGVSISRPLRMVARFARRIGEGERGLRIPLEGSDEIAQLAADFNRMAHDLERTTVSKRELEALAGRLITTQENERSRVARELHDDFTQRLAAAAIEAGRLEQLPPSSELDLRAGLAQLKQQLSETSREVHNLSRRLHRALIEDLGCAVAIETECRAVFERGGPLVDLHLDGDFSGVSRDVQLALYRITQEALRNVQRHSGADEATIRLAHRPSSGGQGGQVELEIHDDGKGFDRSQMPWHPHLGLTSMEERARLLGGTFTIQSAPGKGTIIRATFPADARTRSEETPDRRAET
jgi:signal transduction histidine kinase